jgi:hypothetical protein
VSAASTSRGPDRNDYDDAGANSPSFDVGIKANEAIAPDVCINGINFTPGAPVYAEFYGIPGQTVGVEQGTATVASDGTFSITDFEVASLTHCTTDQLDGTVSVTITGGGVAISQPIPAEAWCDNGSGGGSGFSCP